MNSVKIEDQKQASYKKLSPDDIEVLVRSGIIPEGTPVGQIQLFERFCLDKGISPFAKKIHLIKYETFAGTIWSNVTGIDAFREIAHASGLFAGKTQPRYNEGADGTFKTLYELKSQGVKHPVTCTVSVFKMINNQRVEFTAVCAWDEFVQVKRDKKTGAITPNNNWGTKGFHMLAKCAEALAIRSAFSECSGVYLYEEAGFIENSIGAPTEEVKVIEDPIEREEMINAVKIAIGQIDTKEGLKSYYVKNPGLHKDQDIINIITERANEIEREQDGK